MDSITKMKNIVVERLVEYNQEITLYYFYNGISDIHFFKIIGFRIFDDNDFLVYLDSLYEEVENKYPECSIAIIDEKSLSHANSPEKLYSPEPEAVISLRDIFNFGNCLEMPEIKYSFFRTELMDENYRLLPENQNVLFELVNSNFINDVDIWDHPDFLNEFGEKYNVIVGNEAISFDDYGILNIDKELESNEFDEISNNLSMAA